jgi:hypothetical protein
MEAGQNSQRRLSDRALWLKDRIRNENRVANAGKVYRPCADTANLAAAMTDFNPDDSWDPADQE